MNYYILVPANSVTGGPELCHQFCQAFNAVSNNKCYIAYTEGFHNLLQIVDATCPEKYQKYNCETVSTYEEILLDKGSVVVFPETQTDAIQFFPFQKKVIWWMSVDNYFRDISNENIAMIQSQADYHLVQSKYAYEFINKKLLIPEERIQYLEDYISDDFTQFIFPGEYRKNRIVYNPHKGYQNTKILIENNPDFEWFPLIGLSEKEMVLHMQFAKVYVDFGHHPGKDRIPREAASCGCCIITNKEGSAAYYEDVPIDDMYKFDNLSEQIDQISTLINDICKNFEKHFANFEDYRNGIKNEKEQFYNDVKIFSEKQL